MSGTLDKATKADVEAFVAKIKSPDANVRYEAWRSAGPMGAAAIGPLGGLAGSEDKGVAKAAKGAMSEIAHYAARPSASAEAQAVAAELLKVASSSAPRMVRADALYLIGCVGGAQALPGLVKLLEDTEIREDARLALERIPGSAATTALNKAKNEAPADFRPNLEQSLYNRSLTPKTVGKTMKRP